MECPANSKWSILPYQMQISTSLLNGHFRTGEWAMLWISGWPRIHCWPSWPHSLSDLPVYASQVLGLHVSCPASNLSFHKKKQMDKRAWLKNEGKKQSNNYSQIRPLVRRQHSDLICFNILPLSPSSSLRGGLLVGFLVTQARLVWEDRTQLRKKPPSDCL